MRKPMEGKGWVNIVGDCNAGTRGPLVVLVTPHMPARVGAFRPAARRQPHTSDVLNVFDSPPLSSGWLDRAQPS